ncbi:MAG TPA: hypothetical protein VJ227_00710 [Patescibacteria group bacterium]|nr:hypothetical protein [Patescibacteria group bacterium]
MKQGVLQALAVSVYITLIGLFMWNANDVFGKVDTFLSPILALMLFSVSVMVCGLIVFYKPYKLFMLGKKKEALEVVVATAASLFILLVLFMGALLIFR